jgi:hypothetical protein
MESAKKKRQLMAVQGLQGLVQGLQGLFVPNQWVSKVFPRSSHHLMNGVHTTHPCPSHPAGVQGLSRSVKVSPRSHQGLDTRGCTEGNAPLIFELKSGLIPRTRATITQTSGCRRHLQGEVTEK